MEKLKSHLNQYFWIYVPLCVIALCIFGFWLIGKYEESKLSNEIQTNKANANTAKSAAINANANAVSLSIERKVEDNRRAEIILPKLENYRENSRNSKIRVEKLTKELQQNEKNLHNINASRADNCRELLRLFPNKRFEYCHE